MANSMGIRGFDYIEFYVGSAKASAYWFVHALGFEMLAYKGPETGHRGINSYYLQKNQVKMVLSTAVCPSKHEMQRFTQTHGDGVKRFAYEVDNVSAAFAKAVERGAIPLQTLSEESDKHGSIHKAAIRIYDDTEIVFINSDSYKGLFAPGFEKRNLIQDTSGAKDTGLQHIDHIVGNVHTNEMDKWANYFVRALDFETFIEFGPGDISTQYSALLSKVVRSKDAVIRNPINEPYEGKRKSQIDEYLEQYHGSGVQHIAIACENIIETIDALRSRGVSFLSVPKTYYDDLRKQTDRVVDQDIDELERLGILCDTKDIAGEGYLLQLFTKPISDRPTFFFEFIQRCKGSQGFGQGNFQALFEAIEREQERRGNL